MQRYKKPSKAVKVILKRYNQKSPQLFNLEKKRLMKKLGKSKVHEIFHIGSTALPNISGKGIIDMYLVTKNKNYAAYASKKVEKLGCAAPKQTYTKERLFSWVKRKIGGKKLLFMFT